MEEAKGGGRRKGGAKERVYTEVMNDKCGEEFQFTSRMNILQMKEL